MQAVHGHRSTCGNQESHPSPFFIFLFSSCSDKRAFALSYAGSGLKSTRWQTAAPCAYCRFFPDPFHPTALPAWQAVTPSDPTGALTTSPITSQPLGTHPPASYLQDPINPNLTPATPLPTLPRSLNPNPYLICCVHLLPLPLAIPLPIAAIRSRCYRSHSFPTPSSLPPPFSCDAGSRRMPDRQQRARRRTPRAHSDVCLGVNSRLPNGAALQAGAAPCTGQVLRSQRQWNGADAPRRMDG